MIHANLATLPERAELLSQVYDSIKYQVDYACINMGVVSETNMGDGEKFLKVSEQNGYIFTMDDDLIYPPDYVQTMIDHIERHKRKSIITLHGRTFGTLPIESYYRCKKNGYHWDYYQPEDVRVDSGGSGVMAWHSDTIKINYDDIKHPNMADVWMSVFARRANVPIICVKKDASQSDGWIKYIGPPEDHDNPKTIYSKHFNNDELITEVYNDG